MSTPAVPEVELHTLDHASEHRDAPNIEAHAVHGEAQQDDTIGLITKDAATTEDLQRIRAQKLDSAAHSREIYIQRLKRALLILLFLIMMGSTTLYVAGPGNELFDVRPLADVSASAPHYQALRSWPRYQVEASVAAAAAEQPDTWLQFAVEASADCLPNGTWVPLLQAQRNLSSDAQSELAFALAIGDAPNASLVPGNSCLRAVLRSNSDAAIPVNLGLSQYGILVKYEAVFAVLILLWVYFLIAFEIVHRTVAGAVGAFSALGVLAFVREKVTLRQVVTWIDQDTIGLLFGMMTMVEIFSHSGFFEWAAVRAYRLSRGRVRVLVVALCLLTGIISAFLDNVTTMLLIGPVSMQLASVISVDPVPLLMCEVMFSNVGGTATLIGDPPNIILAEQLRLRFGDFIVALTPCVLLIMAVMVLFVLLWYRREFAVTRSLNISELEQQYGIKDKWLLLECALILGTVVLFFFLEPVLEMQQAWVALLGATVMTLVARPHDIERVLLKIEWSTLLFFMTLFVMLQGLSELGLVSTIGRLIGSLIQQVPASGRLIAALNIMVWVSAVLSAFIDNIPYTVTMVAVIETLSAQTGLPLRPLAWALSLGTCLGGNGTLIGASANVVTVGLLQSRGHPISFMQWFKVGFPFMLTTVAVASLYSTIVYGAAGFA